MGESDRDYYKAKKQSVIHLSAKYIFMIQDAHQSGQAGFKKE